MGLDMYLSKKTYVKRWEHQSDETKFEVTVKKGGVTYPSIKSERVSYITEEIMYWRKANQIHGWFVNNCHELTQDVLYSVHYEQLKELYDTCKNVLDILTKSPKKKVEVVAGWKNGEEYTEEIEVSDLSKADEEYIMDLLPPTQGFFFGSYEIGNWYKEQIEETVKMLEEEINSGTDEYGSEYEYYASW